MSRDLLPAFEDLRATATDGRLYRFHGRTPPQDRVRTPVRAELAAPDTQDGVARLRLYDPIDSWGGYWGVSAKEFADALDGLDDSTTEIRLHINSPGGEVFEGIAILNLLRAHRARVVAVVDGLAASAASFIATGADEVVMGRNTELMIHDAWGICIGNAGDMRDLAGRLDHLSNNIASVYTAKAGGTVEDWRTAMLAESWYSAEEAVAAGLADSVDTGTSTESAEPAAAKDAFDLSAFQHAGRNDAPPPPAAVPSADMPPDASPGLSQRDEVRHRMNERRLRAA